MLRRALRPLALFVGLAIAASALAATQSDYWGDDDAEWAEGMADSMAICKRVKGLEPPAADRPTAAQMAALKDCESTAAYYGLGEPIDYRKARHCAFVEMTAGTNDGPIGAGVLMMLYANGKDVKRDLDYATKMACTVRGAPFEVDARVKTLQALKTEATDVEFDFCDDITSGYAMGLCASIGARREDDERGQRIGEMIADFKPAERAVWDKVLATETAYADAVANGEVDLSGTARGAFALEAESAIKEFNALLLDVLTAGRGPEGDAATLARDDAALNAVYRRVIAQKWEYGTVDAAGVRTAQRAWLKHRDAWAALAALRFPAYRTGVVAYLTRERTRALQCLLIDGPDPGYSCGEGEEE